MKVSHSRDTWNPERRGSAEPRGRADCFLEHTWLSSESDRPSARSPDFRVAPLLDSKNHRAVDTAVLQIQEGLIGLR
jgi:hypothetical protein